jgi:hypothetical protein
VKEFERHCLVIDIKDGAILIVVNILHSLSSATWSLSASMKSAI